MAITDSNGLVYVDGSDSMQPLHPVLNTITTSVSNAFNEQTRIYPATSLTARTALYTKHGATASKPLFVWYTPAPAGRNLMYTVGGNATSDWKYYSSDADVTQSRIWKVANVTGRTTIFNSVGPGTTSNPVIVWRADAPVGQQLEYNVTNSNVVANWYHFSSSQHVDDTGWVTSGLNFTMGGSFTLLNYLFRRIGKQVIGEVNTTITSRVSIGPTGNISDINGVMYLPMEWANGNNAPQRQVQTVQPGVLEMFSRINNGSTRNRVDLTHGLPNTSIEPGSTLRFYFDHTTD